MPDPGADILRAAIEAAGHSARGFASRVLGVDERTVRRWLAGARRLDPTVARICVAIRRDPALAEVLEAAGDEMATTV